jgi:hypothetical protein
MDARRSFYLASRQDDFAESAADLSPIDCADIPYVMPANDNVRTKDRLSARCRTLLRRLIALQRWSSRASRWTTKVSPARSP